VKNGPQYNTRTDHLLGAFKNHIADTYLNRTDKTLTLKVIAERHGKHISSIKRWIEYRKKELGIANEKV